MKGDLSKSVRKQDWLLHEHAEEPANLRKIPSKIYFILLADEIILELEEELESTLKRVNDRIKKRENKHIKISGEGENVKWSLPYEKADETENNPFFEKVQQIEIADLLRLIDNHCGFMGAFTHILDRYVKSDVDNNAITACLVAYATNMGLLKWLKFQT